MDETNRKREEVLSAIREVHGLEPAKGLRLDLKSFSILHLGKSFRHLYTWQLKGTLAKMYLCSLRNSYEGESLNSSYFSEKRHVEGRYLALLIEPKLKLPDLQLRPAFLIDRVSNVFLKFDRKLGSRQKFNRKFILTTQAPNEAYHRFFPETLTDAIEEEKDFSLEVKDNRILLRHGQEIQAEQALSLIRLGKLIDQHLGAWEG